MKDSKLLFEQITTHLGQLKKTRANLPHALDWFMPRKKFPTPRRTPEQMTNSSRRFPHCRPLLRRNDRAIALCFSRANLIQLP